MTDYQDPTFSRRGFARALAAGSLLGFSRAGAGAPFSNLPQLDGELSFDPATRAEYADLRFLRGSEQVRDVGYFEHLDEMPPIDFAQSHADLGLFMPQSAVTSFVGTALPRLTPAALGGVQGIRMFFWKRSSFTRPLFRLPNDQLVCYTALLRSPTSEAEVLARTLAGNRRLYEENRRARGTLYPFAAVELTRGDWRHHYGPQWHDLAKAKRRYDPDAVFASGPQLYFT